MLLLAKYSLNLHTPGAIMYAEFPYANYCFMHIISLEVIFGAGAGSDLLKNHLTIYLKLQYSTRTV
jgi:hypothetical protein